MKYEQDAYEEVIARVPKPGAIVETVDGQGTVIYVNLLREVVKVKLDKTTETELRVYKAEEVKVIKDVAHVDDGDIDIEVLKQLED